MESESNGERLPPPRWDRSSISLNPETEPSVSHPSTSALGTRHRRSRRLFRQGLALVPSFQSPQTWHPNPMLRPSEPQPMCSQPWARKGDGFGPNNTSRDSNSNRHFPHKRMKTRKPININPFQQEEPPMINTCSECDEQNPRYKCPRCLRRYCSATCCQKHKDGSKCIYKSVDGEILEDKEVCLTGGEIKKRNTRLHYDYPTADTLKPEGLERLANEPLRSKIVDMLKSSQLRNKILQLDSSDNPRKLMDTFVQDKDFADFKSFVVESLSDSLFKSS